MPLSLIQFYQRHESPTTRTTTVATTTVLHLHLNLQQSLTFGILLVAVGGP